jgi:hypothetical protein
VTARSHRWSGDRGLRQHVGAADAEDLVQPLAGVQAGDWEVLVDDWSRHVKAAQAADPRDFYSQPAV